MWSTPPSNANQLRETTGVFEAHLRKRTLSKELSNRAGGSEQFIRLRRKAPATLPADRCRNARHKLGGSGNRHTLGIVTHVGMKPKLFPSHFNLLLDEFERSALELLYNLAPHLRDEDELVHRAIQAGIRVLNTEAARQREDLHARGPTRSEIAARRDAMNIRRSSNSVNGEPLSLEARVRDKLLAYLRTNPDAMAREDASSLLSQLGSSECSDA